MEQARLDWGAILALAPVTLVLGLLFCGALGLAIGQSLGFAPWYGINTFPDFSHFARLWSAPAFWAGLGLTLYYGVVSTLMALVLGVGLALALRKSFAGRRLFDHVYKLPLMIPYGVAIALAVLLLGNGGIASRLLAWVGVISDPAQFPRLINTHAGWGIMAVYVWKQTPFITLAVAAVLAGMGRQTQEAAAVLGAGRVRIFWEITLPQILPGLVSAALICLAFNLGAFEAPFILGGGYPDTLPVMAWRAFNDADYGRQLEGTAIALSIALVAGALLLLSLMAYRALERRHGRV